jgi:hypothetical protein
MLSFLLSLAALGAATAAPVRLSPSDANLTYSPYAWLVNGSTATTLNTGANFRLLFTGNSLNITFDTTMMVSPASQLYYRVDNGPQTPFTVGPSIPVAVPFNLTQGGVPYHLLTVSVKSMTETANRWAAGVPSTRIVFTGLELEEGAVTAPIVDSTANILVRPGLSSSGHP